MHGVADILHGMAVILCGMTSILNILPVQHQFFEVFWAFQIENTLFFKSAQKLV